MMAGAERVTKNRDILNRINVFPVPDGDTGTNMSKTLAAAIREMETLKEVSLETTVKAAAWGALMGARGNSGIILAQILSGIAEGVDGTSRLLARDIAVAFSRASQKAHKAVLHPTEGTILTVIRETAKAAEEAVETERDLSGLLQLMVDVAKASVERTPLLLPKLKEAGVVDAGGLGFLFFIEGMLRLIRPGNDAQETGHDEDQLGEGALEATEHEWNYRFCTEFILKGSKISEQSMQVALAEMGDSIVVVGDSRLARVHIHTGEPEDVLRYANTLGQVSSIKVDDMLVQHTSHLDDRSREKSTSVIAIALGDGFKELFYNGGAELVVDGGPTQNPSTADILSAIETVSSSNVVLLPNNKNIYPAAVQAAERSAKSVRVLSTSTVPAGLSALLAYMEDASFDDNHKRMEDASGHIKVGEVLEASRDVTMGGVQVKAGDSIGVFDGKIRCAHKDAEDSLIALVDGMMDGTNEIVTLFYGEMVEKSKAHEVHESLRARYEDKEVEIYFGGQPYGQYIIAIE